MGYKVDICALHTFFVEVSKNLNGLTGVLSATSESISTIVSSESMTGTAANNIKQYLQTVHGNILISLSEIFDIYQRNLLVYINRFSDIDSDAHAYLSTDELSDISQTLTRYCNQAVDVGSSIAKSLTSINDIIYTIPRDTCSMEELYNKTAKSTSEICDKIADIEESHIESDFADIEKAVSSLKGILNDQLTYDRNYVSNYEQIDTLSSNLYFELYTALNNLGQKSQKNVDKVESALNNEQRLQEIYREEDISRSNYRNGLIKFGLGAITAIGAVAATILTLGAAAPAAVTAVAVVVEGGVFTYGVSEMYEGNEQAWYGMYGNVHSVAFNPIRDTFFEGNQIAYDLWGMANGIATSMMMPVIGNAPQVGHLSNEISSGVNNVVDDAVSGVESVNEFNVAYRYGIDINDLNFSNTVQNHTGRPYQDVKLLINEIIESKQPIPDPRGTNALSWMVEGTFNGSTGCYELIIDPDSNTVWHFVFKSQ